MLHKITPVSQEIISKIKNKATLQVLNTPPKIKLRKKLATDVFTRTSCKQKKQ